MTKFKSICLILSLASCMPVVSISATGVDIIISTTGGEWANEMGWELLDDNDNLYASIDGASEGVTSEEVVCLQEGCYVLVATDSWGDGWNGGVVVIQGEDIELEIELFGPIGYFTFEIDADPCDWEFSGCTDSNSPVFTPGATIDDGSCWQDFFEFEYDGITRHYLLHVPDNLPTGAPLVFNIHGGGVSASDTQLFSQMDALADSEGFAVCYPQGLDLLGIPGFPMWNANLNYDPPIDIDDSGFLAALAEFLQDEHDFSPECTYACGWSTGGFMCFTLACEHSDVFKAIGSLAGTMSETDWAICDPDNTVPIVQIIGMQDTLVPYEGVPLSDELFTGGPGISDLMDFWADYVNDCSELVSTIESDLLELDVYSNCLSDTECWEYRVLDGEHDWFGVFGSDAINVTEAFWSFFSEHCGSSVSIPDIYIDQNLDRGHVVSIVDALGREMPFTLNRLMFYRYQDGFIERRFVLD